MLGACGGRLFGRWEGGKGQVLCESRGWPFGLRLPRVRPCAAPLLVVFTPGPDGVPGALKHPRHAEQVACTISGLCTNTHSQPLLATSCTPYRILSMHIYAHTTIPPMQQLNTHVVVCKVLDM